MIDTDIDDRTRVVLDASQTTQALSYSCLLKFCPFVIIVIFLVLYCYYYYNVIIIIAFLLFIVFLYYYYYYLREEGYAIGHVYHSLCEQKN